MKNKYNLCFLWISTPGFLNNIEYNFLSDRKFHVIEIGYNEWEVKVEVLQDNYIEIPRDFFGNKISNVTGIVGKNGSGKTSFINFFANNICNLTFNYEGHISVWMDENGHYKITHNLKKLKFMKENYLSDCFDSNFPEVIVLSNVFDGRYSREYGKKNNKDYKKLLSVTDYSLNSFINSKYKSSKQNYTVAVDFIEKSLIEDCISFMRGSENKFKRMMEMNIDCLPNVLTLTIQNNLYLSETMKSESHEIDEFLKRLKETYGINTNRFKKLCVDECGYIETGRQCYESVINKLGLYLWAFTQKILECNEIDSRENIVGFLNTLEHNEDVEKNALSILLEIYKNNNSWGKLEPVKTFIEFINKNFDYDNSYHIISTDKLACKFDTYKIDDIALKFYELANKVLELLNTCIQIDDFFELKLEYAYDKNKKIGFSTGEMMKFRTYIELYKAFSNMESESAIIIIDEWDAYLHPAIQQTGIRDIVRFINEVFKKESVHLIITSNAPFMISDLPLNNIIFLDDGKQVDKITNTFAQNIHTLLKDNFFMQQTIGEFANQNIKGSLKIMDKYKQLIDKKINKMEFKEDYMQYMNCTKEVDIDKMKKKIKYIIEIIGEPLIKRKLEEKYRTTFFKDIRCYEKEIKKLQLEQEKLKDIIKNNGLDNVDGIMALLEDKIKELQNKVEKRIFKNEGDIIDKN
ncbi:hypothetical protein I6U48_22275 [Clostridium sp. PL3]|uniref:ATPase AAA-type core domain-containing protein n=1 Tax=Clostridium thailandense TaxID=2794346 RepID=A0A949WSV9_9CLOT|nr:hypothetical protein [Clostridium thailandense]MBV7275630.1 hypothetical protein [Clostridium thailandense]